jgi:hypothetical protein
MRELEELARDIDRFTLESRGIPALRAHIRANWTIDEVLFFKHFTHCGTFSPPGGAWRIEYPCGYIASTAQGMANLVALFDKLQAEAWAYMGARLYADMKSDTPSAALLCDSYRFGGLTLSALVQTLPANWQGQVSKLLKQGEANAATLAGIDATTRATDGKVDALMGRGADFAVKPSRMAQLITAALAKEGNHKGITGRTVENWAAYLKTGGEKGTRPPAGFTLNTLRTLETATEFAAQYAAGDARRLKVDMAFNEHDSRLEEEARRRHADEQEARFKRLDG